MHLEAFTVSEMGKPWLQPPYEIPKAGDMARLHPARFPLDSAAAALAATIYGDGWREQRFFVEGLTVGGSFVTVVQGGVLSGAPKIFEPGELVKG